MTNFRSFSKPPRRGRLGAAAAVGAVFLLLAPGPARAQSIGGVVTDTTGGVLPGVTVEARSPALIEQVRAAITDGSGQYQIVALETGVYTVTFTLPGFSTLVREGVELSTGFTANIDAQLAVGALEETVTVTEASPIIDVQSVRQSETIDREIYEALPTSKTYDAMAVLIPAMNIAGGPTTTVSVDTSGVTGMGNNRLSIHGSEESDGEMQLDGLDVGLVALEGAPEGTPLDTAIAEYVYDYSANSAEVETGGVRLNLIPKEGSNAFSGGFYTDFAHSSWLSNNVDQELIDRGIAGGRNGALRVDQQWYTGPSLGGPIVRDRLWFFATWSYRRASQLPAGLFDNSDTSALAYVPDLDRPTIDRQNLWEGTLRLTWQATSKDKVQTFWGSNNSQQIPSLSGSQLDPIYIAPEAGSEGVNNVNTYQLTWVRPQTNRILFEFGVSLMPANNILNPLDAETQRLHGTGREHLDARTDLPSVFEGTTLTMSRNMGFFFNGTDVHFSTYNRAFRGAMSYVTGSHNLKFGFTSNIKGQTETYRSANNWTNMLTIVGRPLEAYFESRPPETNELVNVGVYAQDQWTIDRLTINAGLRFDYFKGSYPDHVSAPGAVHTSVWVPRGSSFPGATAAVWKDLQPRLGVVYDLRGDGRTAIKASVSRFGSRDAIALAGELNPAANNRRQTRLWLDGANTHFVLPRGTVLPSCIGPVACIPGDGLPQGDPLNPFPNGELMSPTDNPAFGAPIVTEAFDPDWAMGWGKKKANWEYALSIEHELVDNVSVDVGYFRRHYVNFDEWDNLNVGPEDFDRYTIMVPADDRLPNGGGFPLTLVDMTPEAFARLQNNRKTGTGNLGAESDRWHGFDFNLSARLEGVLLQGGLATGQRTTDVCGLQEAAPEVLFGSPTTYTASRVLGTAGSRGNLLATDFCRAERNWLTNVSVFGSYTFPYGIDVSAAFFSRPGTVREAIYTVPADEVVAALGRPATVGSAASMNVIPPGTAHGDRFHQFDLRIGRVFDLRGGGDVRASLDVFNLFNGNSVSRERYGFSAGGVPDSFLQPLGVQPGRLAKVTFQYSF